MAKGFYRAVLKKLKDAEFHYAGNAKGSHEWWDNNTTGLRVMVPKNLESRHTANAIMVDAGIDHHF